MSLLPTSNERAIKEEIVELAGALAETQERLVQLAARLDDDDPEDLRARYKALQDAHKEAVNGAKWLRAQNIDLELRLQQHKPEMINAVAARDMAFQKLKHARKVIRDLLAERADMSSPRGSGALTQREIDEALEDDSNRSDSSSSTSTDSNKTVRLGDNIFSPSHSQEQLVFSPVARSSGSSASLQTSPASLHMAPAGSHTSSARSPARSISSPQSNKSAFFSPLSGRSESFVSSMHVLSRAHSPTSTRASPEPMRIHFKNPPGVSNLQEGPITWAKLETALNLDEDAVNSLSSIASSPDVGMRLQIMQYQSKSVIACLYDPILVDIPGKSYILDWDRSLAKRNLEKYIYRHKAIDTTFHTFLFPPSENNWFYIGGLQWSRFLHEDFWPKLDEANKKKILKKLCKRTKGEVDEIEMAKLLDNGDLQQLCIELTAVGDGQVSHDFATEILGRQASPYSPPRRERGVKE